MEIKNQPDKQLSQIMKKSQLQMPFGDFEEMVMHRIQLESNHQQILSSDRKLSFFFFILGSTLGLVVNFILERSQHIFFGVSPETILLVFQVAFVLLFLIQLENFIKLRKKFKKQLR